MNKPLVHALKVWPEYFDAIAEGDMTFDIRKNDRNFQPGQGLALFRYDPEKLDFTRDDTGKPIVLSKRIRYILNDRDGRFGLQLGYVALGLENDD